MEFGVDIVCTFRGTDSHVRVEDMRVGLLRYHLEGFGQFGQTIPIIYLVSDEMVVDFVDLQIMSKRVRRTAVNIPGAT